MAMNPRGVAFFVGLMASAVPCAGWAQDTALQDSAPQQGATAQGDEIVVTARRREELLSRVPISITAISSEGMADRAIRNENDLQAAVPGLVIKQTSSANAFVFVIRGQTIDAYTNSPPGVLQYINEAQVATWSASTFYDIAGVQVLKGPQGTLFGRNTTGGAVLFQTTEPTHDLGGYVSGRYGRWDNYQVQGAVNLPISESLALRVAGSKTGGGAYILRLDTDSRYGNLEQESIRGSLLFEPSASFKNTLTVQHTSDGGTNAPAAIYRSSQYACGNGRFTDSADCFFAGYPYGIPGIGTPVALSFMANGVVGLANAQDELGPYTIIGQNSSLEHRARSTFAINTTEVRFGSDMLLKNIAMFNNSWSDERNDYDGSPFGLIGIPGALTADLTSQTNESGFYNRSRQFSNELQLQGEAFEGNLDFVFGLYYINQVNRIDANVKFFDFFPVQVYGDSTFIRIRYRQDTKEESYSGFAQGTYALADNLGLTAGFRYTQNRLTARQLPGSDFFDCAPRGCFTGVPAALIPAGPDHFESRRESRPSWNVSLDYQTTPELLLYVTHRGSWRAGGFNYTVSPVPVISSEGGNVFTPEKAYDIEAGLKYAGSDLGFPVTFNLALYNLWIQDIQRGANLTSPFSGTSILVTASVPAAQVNGFEADINFRPTSWLAFGGSLAYTNARFTKNVVPVLNNPALEFGPYGDVPKWSGSIFAQVSHELGSNAGTLRLHGDIYMQSMFFYSSLDTIMPGSNIDGYALAGARLAWENLLGTSASVSLYGRNLTNTEYYTGGNPSGVSAGVMTAYPGFPRTYGLEMKVDF